MSEFSSDSTRLKHSRARTRLSKTLKARQRGPALPRLSLCAHRSDCPVDTRPPSKASQVSCVLWCYFISLKWRRTLRILRRRTLCSPQEVDTLAFLAHQKKNLMQLDPDTQESIRIGEMVRQTPCGSLSRSFWRGSKNPLRQLLEESTGVYGEIS